MSALNSNNSRSSFSNYGPDIDLAAPGSRLISAVPWDNYTRMSGTSMAAPVVAGVAGLVLSAYTDLSGTELRNHLQSTAVDVGLSANAQGDGRVDAGQAVTTVPEGYDGETPDSGNEDEEDESDDDDEQDEQSGRLLAFITDQTPETQATSSRRRVLSNSPRLPTRAHPAALSRVERTPARTSSTRTATPSTPAALPAAATAMPSASTVQSSISTSSSPMSCGSNSTARR